ncbi:hypothetical protein [Bradyrhizobium sp.]|uniref:hypothetical protein n=1 Tax=Bradyrhizobium sp. TaxID=376 RepID=UPI0025C5522A|nr:hypothetical protein [Bradyrhizobium sp.]
MGQKVETKESLDEKIAQCQRLARGTTEVQTTEDLKRLLANLKAQLRSLDPK